MEALAVQVGHFTAVAEVEEDADLKAAQVIASPTGGAQAERTDTACRSQRCLNRSVMNAPCPHGPALGQHLLWRLDSAP